MPNIFRKMDERVFEGRKMMNWGMVNDDGGDGEVGSNGVGSRQRSGKGGGDFYGPLVTGGGSRI
jgi:hypothetical protein